MCTIFYLNCVLLFVKLSSIPYHFFTVHFIMFICPNLFSGVRSLVWREGKHKLHAVAHAHTKNDLTKKHVVFSIQFRRKFFFIIHQDSRLSLKLFLVMRNWFHSILFSFFSILLTTEWFHFNSFHTIFLCPLRQTNLYISSWWWHLQAENTEWDITFHVCQ